MVKYLNILKCFMQEGYFEVFIQGMRSLFDCNLQVYRIIIFLISHDKHFAPLTMTKAIFI